MGCWNRFSGLPVPQKPLKRLQALGASSTPLKRGVNERCLVSMQKLRRALSRGCLDSTP